MTTAVHTTLESCVVFARSLAEAGALGPAAVVLAGLLCARDPATAAPDDRLIEAAMLYPGLVY
ncbi:hypothetical protein Dvina_37455 [Dactylosporangium vinaceum]|uniref:Uncharacterized protein n=1 Tax=Dactylosporangium vinaceum TaxID=53362 RepID=A0ABV5MQX5_9ACTN|nr:hypothetical protein [Dactylosporangium vinaceum]UAB93850.1 hypothetical protein Dvina_37455 [Dactylosporangium vinaceum]